MAKATYLHIPGIKLEKEKDFHGPVARSGPGRPSHARSRQEREFESRGPKRPAAHGLRCMRKHEHERGRTQDVNPGSDGR